MADLIALPSVVYGPSINFDAIRTRSAARMLGRRTETLFRGTPYWVATYAAAKLTTAEAGLFDAFNMLASDGGVFAAYDPFRPRPIAYQGKNPLSGVKAGGGAFNGDATLQSITGPLGIVVAGCPAGFQLLPGDYVEVRSAPLVRSLHRITAPAVANGAGVVSLQILYWLDAQHFAPGNTVHFEKAACIMEMDQGSFSLPKSWPNLNVQFSATEMFYS